MSNNSVRSVPVRWSSRAVHGWTTVRRQTAPPTKGAAPRNMPFSMTYGETVANSRVLNFRVRFMLKVGGVGDGLERKSQESGSGHEKVLHARGTGLMAQSAMTPF